MRKLLSRGENMSTKYTKNPFIFNDQLEIKTKKKHLTVEKGTEIEKDNEVFTTTISQIQEVDKEQFIKLYINQINIFFDLSITANKLFHIIMFALSKEIGKDTIYLSLETAQELSSNLGVNLSSAVYYRALKELQEKKIIAESNKKFIYYINPAVIFNGDRAKFVKEIRLKHEEQEKKSKGYNSTELKKEIQRCFKLGLVDNSMSDELIEQVAIEELKRA